MDFEEEDFLVTLAVIVANGDSKILQQTLEMADFTDSTLEDICFMYYYMLQLCHKEGKGELIRIVSDYFADNLTQGSRLESYVLSKRPMSMDVFNFYYENNGRKFEFYAKSLFSLPEEPPIHEIWHVLINLDSVKGNLTYSRCRKLLDSLYLRSEEETPYGEVIEELLKQLLSQYADTIAIPEHILDPLDFGFEEVPLYGELLEKLPIRPADLSDVYKTSNRSSQIKEIARSIAQESYEFGQIRRGQIPMETIKIEQSVQNMDFEEFQNFFATYEQKQWEKSLQDNTEIHRILGPCHPKLGAYELDTTSEDPCLRYGGCRMMTCVEFEEHEDGIEVNKFWFTGSCDRCSQNIPNMHWAFRVALPQGGFQGCYCSKEHAVDECIDQGQPLASKLTEKICQSQKEIGLYNRRWEEVDKRKERRRHIKLGQEFLQFLDSTSQSVVLAHRNIEFEDNTLTIVSPK